MNKKYFFYFDEKESYKELFGYSISSPHDYNCLPALEKIGLTFKQLYKYNESYKELPINFCIPFDLSQNAVNFFPNSLIITQKRILVAFSEKKAEVKKGRKVRLICFQSII